MSDSKKTIAALKAELRKAEDEIDAAYWRFTRQARAKPPIMVCPQAYKRRAAIEAELSARRVRR